MFATAQMDSRQRKHREAAPVFDNNDMIDDDILRLPECRQIVDSSVEQDKRAIT